MQYLILILIFALNISAKDKKDEKNSGSPEVKVQIQIGAPQPRREVIVVNQPVEKKVYVVKEQDDEDGEHHHHKHKHEYCPRFSDNDVYIVREYYKKIPPGQAKKHHYKPEWRREIVVGRAIPDYIVVEQVPVELEESLPPLPKNYVRVMVGQGIVIKDISTGFVVDARFEW